MNTSFLLILLLTLTSCANRIDKIGRDAKYAAWEMVGVEKRGLFKREVENVKDAQRESGEDFKDALAELKSVYGFEGGALEGKYGDFDRAYQDAEASAKDVRASVTRLETVAEDLFVEWKMELAEIRDPSLRSRSREKLDATQARFGQLRRQLHVAQDKMDPVLERFHDQVLFIKHNLNAKAVGSLKTEGDKINREVGALLKAMGKSMAEADRLIEAL